MSLRLQLPRSLARLCTTPSDQPVDALPLSLPGLDPLLPDGGLPRNSVVELAAPDGLGLATRLALAACAAAQSRGQAQRHDRRSAWCAWLDPFSSLYAPGAAAAGVELERLLVVMPSLPDLARVAVRVVASGIFSMVVVDRSGVDGIAMRRQRDRSRWQTVTRRLALAAETNRCTVLLLSSSAAAQRDRLPTALRLELARTAPDQLSLRVAKDRRGRNSGPATLSLQDAPGSPAVAVPTAASWAAAS